MKQFYIYLVLILLGWSNLAQADAVDSEEGIKAKCTWVETKTNTSFFAENAYMIFNFLPAENGEDIESVKIIEDTFLNRCESENPKQNCDMAFSYDGEDVWKVSEEGEYDITLTQVWQMGTEHGTVGGVSEIKGVNTEKNGGNWTISGDDGDGVWFTEPFKCEFLNFPF